MNYIIRLANDSDCEELSRLKHMVWEETYRGIYPDYKIDDYDYMRNEEKFRNIIANPKVELYTIEDNNTLVGYMDYGVPYRPYKDYEQEIGLLYLLKRYQGQGIGKKLFDLAYTMIKDNGYDEFFVSCNKYNINAIDFYKRMGGIKDYIDEDNVDKSIPQVKLLYKIRR